MVMLIVIFIFSSFLAFFATQNTAGVSINYLGYIWRDIPTYMVVVGSILVGLVIAGVINFINTVTNSFTLMGKDRKIKETSQEMEELKKRITQLEAENKQLAKDRDDVSP